MPELCFEGGIINMAETMIPRLKVLSYTQACLRAAFDELIILWKQGKRWKIRKIPKGLRAPANCALP